MVIAVSVSAAGAAPIVDASLNGRPAEFDDRTRLRDDRRRLQSQLVDHRRQAEGGQRAKLYLYVAIDRTSKFAFVQLVKKTGRTSASAFLEALIAAVPYKIHTVLTENGIQFTFPPRYADGPTARYATHMFDMRCQENGIEHRLTKIKHPWTNGQVERMNRTIKEATVQRYHYDRHDQLEAHLADFISAYNYARRLKTLKGLTPYEFICKCWTSQPERFKLNPLQKMPRLNT